MKLETDVQEGPAKKRSTACLVITSTLTSQHTHGNISGYTESSAILIQEEDIAFKGSNPLYPGTVFLKKKYTKYYFVAAVPDMCCVACFREEHLKLKNFLPIQKILTNKNMQISS